MSERADRELVRLAQRGDGAAVGELFSRYWRASRAVAFGITGEFASAEDAAAEAFKQALLGMDSLRDPDRFGSWLRTIVVRKARLGLQSRLPTIDASARQLADENERPDRALEQYELQALIQQAIRGLPPTLREAIALVYFEGYDSEAAAQFLDIPAGTLRRRLHDGRTRLRTTVEQVSLGRRQMKEEREREVQMLKTMIENGEIYQAMRGFLALRPPPNELVDMFLGRQAATKNDSKAVKASQDRQRKQVSRMVQRLLRPSERASDPSHPLGAVAAAIRKALPDFQDWPLNAGKAAARFEMSTGERRNRLRAIWPPGFAKGRPGAFLRATRAMVSLDVSGSMQSMYEHLEASPDEPTFRGAKSDIRLSDVLDLTWMVAGSLELRSVQELLERLSSAVIPGAQIRFSTYDEPRYRSALQLHIGGVPARAALGGVLVGWIGRPQGTDAAYVRIFLEPWASHQSGQVVVFDPLPDG